ncbi:hypothetical protein [Bdellovibrio sp. HCB288]|uniref:hypothetical protein n=1 Tax=Bdellovibrio sp. HCB288 TaxID=3394355 RepID=UPI0039B37DAB
MKISISSLIVMALVSFSISTSAQTKKSTKKSSAKTTATENAKPASPAPEATPVAAQPSPTATPVAAETPAAEPKESDDYTRPLFFAVSEPDVKIKAPVIAYDLKSDKGNSLKIADYVFNSDSLAADVENGQLKVTWDTTIMQSGDLSIIDSFGKELWKTKVDKSGDWKFDLKSEKGPQWQSGNNFRFCLRSEIEKGFTAMCTQNYGIEIKGDEIILDYVKSDATPRIIALNEERKNLKDNLEVAIGAPVGFLATLKSGATYEFMSEPIQPDLRDFIESTNKDAITFKGALPAPVGDSKVTPRIIYGAITKTLGFQKTIAEPSDLWEMDVALKNPRLHFAGKYGGVFTYELEIKNYPKQKDRLFAHKDVLQGTYSTKDQMKIKVNKDAKVEGLEPLDEKDKDSDLRNWKFSADQKYQLNKPQLLVSEGEQSKTEPHKAYIEVYRGGAGEASLRLSGISTTQGGSTFVGEVHLQYWFNDLFDWQNRYLSKQRWGVSAKYFTSLADVTATKENDETEKVSLNSTEVDLRYRFSQGLWERDETVGAIFAYEALTIGEQKANKMGAGLFWARSMPKAFDDLLNYIPFMKYPKFVDMEYIQFFGSTDSGTKMGNDFLLNFHGKVLWTNNFFGELGFGVKKYDFTNADESGATLSTFYGTVGLGVNF